MECVQHLEEPSLFFSRRALCEVIACVAAAASRGVDAVTGDHDPHPPAPRLVAMLLIVLLSATHIVALLAICTDSKLLRSGVSRRVMVDGESFVDALFACACRG